MEQRLHSQLTNEQLIALVTQQRDQDLKHFVNVFSEVGIDEFRAYFLGCLQPYMDDQLQDSDATTVVPNDRLLLLCYLATLGGGEVLIALHRRAAGSSTTADTTTTS